MGCLLAHCDLVHELACGHLSLRGLPPIQAVQNTVGPSSTLGPIDVLTVILDPSMVDHDLTPSPDWRRFTVLSLWYIAGYPVAYIMREPCISEAPGTWGRAIRVFIEGIVAFGLAGSIYVSIFLILTCWVKMTAFFFALVYQGLGRCLLPAQPRSRVVLPFLPEKKSPAPSNIEPNCTVETV